jgi:hypothetical protein
MTTTQRIVRRALVRLGVWLAVQAVLFVIGRLLARRFDEGDESTAGIRRVKVLGGFELAPRNPELTRVRIDLVMAGAELDLTGIGETAGIDLTVTTVMAGMAVKVPPDWRVWSRFLGVGGLGTDGGVQRTSDEHGADLRVHGRALFGGIGVEAVP